MTFNNSSNSGYCIECGRPMENTPSGLFSTCPLGHGKLMPPLMPKPFDRKDVPRTVAVCPECDGELEIECDEWTIVDGVSRPTQAGLIVYCDAKKTEEDEHQYNQCDWMPVQNQVCDWLEAVN